MGVSFKLGAWKKTPMLINTINLHYQRRGECISGRGIGHDCTFSIIKETEEWQPRLRLYLKRLLESQTRRIPTNNRPSSRCATASLSMREGNNSAGPSMCWCRRGYLQGVRLTRGAIIMAQTEENVDNWPSCPINIRCRVQVGLISENNSRQRVTAAYSRSQQQHGRAKLLDEV